jgi:hypothetical protein
MGLIAAFKSCRQLLLGLSLSLQVSREDLMEQSLSLLEIGNRISGLGDLPNFEIENCISLLIETKRKVILQPHVVRMLLHLMLGDFLAGFKVLFFEVSLAQVH